MSTPHEVTHVIGGRSTASASAERIRVLDPSSGQLSIDAPAGCEVDAAAAVEAAQAALSGWAQLPGGERAARLLEAGERVIAVTDQLADAERREMGKPQAMARRDILDSAQAFARYAGLIEELPVDGGGSRVLRRPYGVAAVVVPWNYPVSIALDVMVPILAAGNCVVLKPSERSPYSASLLGQVLNCLGSGVVNVLLGDGRAGGPLVGHPDVGLVHFTGSVATGRRVAAEAGRRLAPAFLELGGKDALIADAGVDPDWAAGVAASRSFENSGQVCTSVERIYVHREIAEPFLGALVRRAQALVVGDPADPATDLGPMVDARQRDLVHAQVVEALAGGAHALTGGAVPGGPGCFYPPTVLVDVPADGALLRQETFGPIAPVVIVDSFAEALDLADGGEYGLAATVLTADPEHAVAAGRLDVGIVQVNEGGDWPEDAVYEPARASGLGQVRDGLALVRSYQRPTTVVVGTPSPL